MDNEPPELLVLEDDELEDDELEDDELEDDEFEEDELEEDEPESPSPFEPPPPQAVTNKMTTKYIKYLIMRLAFSRDDSTLSQIKN